jgi:dihydropteroate synthase
MKIGARSFDFTRPTIMGVLNITPDSFSDGGKFMRVNTAVAQAHHMVAAGADIIDVGGESSRPGSDPVSVKDELRRVQPVIKKLVTELKVPISIDTYKPRVAHACLSQGAHLVNDITGLENSEMVEVIAEHRVPVVLMHMKGKPKTMQEQVSYAGDIISEIKRFFTERIARARDAGINDIILDPGIGFGKTVAHNLVILKRLHEFTSFGYPILIGPSRKSFIGTITGLPVEERLEGTLASTAIGVMNGARMVRTHDVKSCKRAIQVSDAIRTA